MRRRAEEGDVQQMKAVDSVSIFETNRPPFASSDKEH